MKTSELIEILNKHMICNGDTEIVILSKSSGGEVDYWHCETEPPGDDDNVQDFCFYV